MAFFVQSLIWWILIPFKKGEICKKSSGSDRPLSVMDRQKEIGTSQPAWFLWKSRSTQRERGFRMPQYGQQPLESKWHSLWHGGVIVLVVVPTAVACQCQTSHRSTRLWDCQEKLDEQEAVNRRTGASVQLLNSLPGSLASRVPYCLPVQQLIPETQS